ncbi:hypothetical protein KBI23_18880 [bacterium]|jgi:hypothetical protein|nr:hypothetical protein [bacterium]MBP9811028.1 hypothetical protein [bacterium]
MLLTDRCSITLTSQPHKRRAGLVPLCTAICLGWAFVLMWLTVAVIILWEWPAWGVLIGLSSVTFGALLTLFGLGLIRDSRREYLLELTESEVVLVVTDRKAKKKGTLMLLLADVTYAEYYPYTDSASIIFHTNYSKMEVPLWPMGDRAQDVVDFLDGRGVRVINVQSDDCLPSAI